MSIDFKKNEFWKQKLSADEYHILRNKGTERAFSGEYWNSFENTCLDRHDPFERYINEIYEKEICLSPLSSLSIHMTNVNSSYGLAPFIDYKKMWDQNK